jgi:phage repressor protein C with HTH and peptisase S24 domain
MQKQSADELAGREIVERLCVAYDVSTVPRLAAAMGEPLPTVKGWWQRSSVPLHAVARAAVDTKRSLDWLVLGLEETQTQSSLTVAPPSGGLVRVGNGDAGCDFYVVPRYAVEVSAGTGKGTLESESLVGAFAFEAVWMRENLGRTGRGFACVQVRGDSMQPTLWAGDEIVIDVQVTRVDVSGIYVIALRGDLLVKRVQRKLDGSLVVKSDNPAYEPEHIGSMSAEDFRVVGRLVWPRVR